jgi:hypothetical protein
VDHVLKNGFVGRAGRSPAGDAGIGEDNVELPGDRSCSVRQRSARDFIPVLTVELH